jgi:ABC-type sulfate transport system permease component
LAGPQITVYIKSSSGGYQGALVGAAFFSAAAFIFTLILRRLRTGAK